MKLNVLFMGTPEFSVPSLDMLFHHPAINLVGTISMPSRPSGRGKNLKDPEVITYCKNQKISFWQTENINKDDTLLKELETKKIDLIVVLAFAQFLGKKVLSLPKKGAYNIHTSLLPKYRGAAPIQYALLNGDKKTGVSIQKMVKKMDAGDLALSHPIDISDDETGGQLYTRLKYQAALSLNDFISLILKNTLVLTPQDENFVSFAPSLKKDDGFLDFKNHTAKHIINQIRALKPWPGTYCFLEKIKLKVLQARISTEEIDSGKVIIKDQKILIGTKTKALSLDLIQLPSKKAVNAQQFLNGYKKEMVINP